MKRFDVIVSGAQLTGAATAVALARLGLQVLLLDSEHQEDVKSSRRTGSRTTALSPSSIAWLEEFVVPNVEGAPIFKMHVWEGEGSASVTFDCETVGANQLARVVPHLELVDSIHDQTSGLVERKTGVTIESLDNDAHSVHLNDGTSCHCELLVIAEGGNSATRNLLDVKIHRQRLKQSAITSSVVTSVPHENIAYQRFGEGVLALLPCVSSNEVSLIWSVDDDVHASLSILGEKAFCDRVTVVTEETLGTIQECGERASFPLEQSLVDSLHPRSWILIVGDAAHSIHPLAGQGANLALEDVRSLTQLIANRADALRDPVRLATYANRRKMRARMLIGTMTFFFKTWQSDNPYFRVVRNIGVDSVDKFSFLKLQLVREAMGFGPMARVH